VLERVFILAMISTALSACVELPSSGPTARQIMSESKLVESAATPADKSSPYVVVDINPLMAGRLAKSHLHPSGSRFASLTRSGTRGIGVGDTVTVTIFESSAGGLFGASTQVDGATSSAPNFTLPPQAVDRSGTITVPYAGAINVVGLSPQQVQKKIESRLSKRAIEPQVIVTIVGNESRLVTVTGDVEKGGRVPLNTGNEKLLDALAVAGGPRGTSQDTYIKLTRGRSVREMQMDSLVNSPSDNVALQPGDQIFVYQNPKTFVALGANLANAEVKFDAASLTLAEAIGRAGGLNDDRANPAGVFVFRYENADIYRSVSGLNSSGDKESPIIYRLNLKGPGGFIAAQRFPMRDKDVVFFSNSPSTELSKFLALLGAGFTTTYSGISTAAKLSQ
jgi:polysaccharide biosynthesis/export protein